MPNVTYNAQSFSIDGRRIWILGASIEYARVLPEAWATGFAMDDLEACAEATPRALAALTETAGDWGGFLVAGSFFTWEGDRLYNELIVLNRREVVATYRKLHLFEGLGERESFRPGRSPVLMETPLGPAGLALCYDLRFPELFRWYRRRKARLFIVPAQWPEPRIEHWRLLARARAVENLAYFVGVNCAGQPESDLLHGHSLVVDPWGDVLWEAGQEECVGFADIERACVDALREKLPAEDDARTDLLAP